MMTIFNSEVYYVHIHKGNFRVVALYQLPFSACYTFLSFHSFFELTSPPFQGPTEHFVFMLYHQTIYLHMNRPYSIIKAIFIQIFSRPSPSVHKSESINFQGDFHTIAFEAYALFECIRYTHRKRHGKSLFLSASRPNHTCLQHRFFE